MAAVTNAGVIWNTTAGNKTVTATPAVGDLIVIFAAATLLTGPVGATNVSDNNTTALDDGSYTKIGSSFTGFSTSAAGGLDAWVRNKLIAAASSTIFTAAQSASNGGGLIVFRISGMSICGLGAIRGAGGQTNGTAGGTPAPVLLRRVGTSFSGTQAALTGNTCLGTVCNGTNSTTTVTQPASWTEASDLGYNTPPSGMENCFRNSGETNSTITFGSTTLTQFASLVVELDTTVPFYEWVNPGAPDHTINEVQQGVMGRAATWMQGARREWKRSKSGILVPELNW